MTKEALRIKLSTSINVWLLALVNVYFVGLFVWALVHGVIGDRWWWLFALNALAPYLFLPLPAILLLAFRLRRRETWVGLSLALVLFAYLYGGLFLPRLSAAPANGPKLTVMAYNVLGFNMETSAVVEAIRASQADVIALQELNPENAAAIQRELAEVYPYQILNPQEGVAGSGVISRYPLRPTGEQLLGSWIGTPHVLEVDFDGQPVTLLRFHAYPGINNVAPREAQARIIAHFASAHPGPFIAAGDFNATDMHVAYRILTEQLQDSWREAGWGFGQTFPGAASLGSSRPTLAGIPVPMWLVRIDYVFHSDDFTAAAARVGPWDGTSDHRPVVAELVLRK